MIIKSKLKPRDVKYLVVLNPAPDLQRFSNTFVLNRDKNYAMTSTPLRTKVKIKLRIHS
jgi:hypothetical protein